MNSYSHSVSLPPPKQRRSLTRSPSEPGRIGQVCASGSSNSQQIYVLSADGSSLFLLDPSKPPGNEEPPPYAPFRSDVSLQQHSSAEQSPASPPGGLGPLPLAPIVLPEHHPRHRARTVSGQPIVRIESSPVRPHIRTHRSSTHVNRQPPSTLSSPSGRSAALPTEHTRLLATPDSREDWIEINWPATRRGVLRSIFCGELQTGDNDLSWNAGWERFWRPVGQGHYWKAMAHLWLLNFPFALFVWPLLLVGTLVGTALLITLPLGAAVWWLTLFIARWAARLEVLAQLHYHSPLAPSSPQPIYRPIFHRIKEHVAPSSASIHAAEAPGYTEVEWETRFLKCSYAMLTDHYSYSALCYFLLIKPLIVLLSSIVLWALIVPSAVLVFPLPVYLRAARRWGKWQAGVAMENL